MNRTQQNPFTCRYRCDADNDIPLGCRLHQDWCCLGNGDKTYCKDYAKDNQTDWVTVVFEDGTTMKIRPCPECGSTNIKVETMERRDPRDNQFFKSYRLFCSNCGHTNDRYSKDDPKRKYMDFEEYIGAAADVWNAYHLDEPIKKPKTRRSLR